MEGGILWAIEYKQGKGEDERISWRQEDQPKQKDV